jgi:nucleoside phosphorylase
MTSAAEARPTPPHCSLLLFLATSAEEEALERAASELGVEFKKDPELTKWLRAKGLGDEVWRLGTIGAEAVVAVGPSRERGRPVMGAHGRLGSAAKAIRYLTATGAQGIVQIGMAFGISPKAQKLGDVLVSALLAPFDNRAVKPSDKPPGYENDYTEMKVELPRSSLIDRCRREKQRGKFEFGIHIGAMLSGAARIHCAAYRDELLISVPHGNEEIVGGEMEGVGLLSGSVNAEDSTWCVVKGICDFADENRNKDIVAGRKVAPYHAALFVLSSLLNDARMLAG